MGLIAKLTDTRATPENPTTSLNPAEWLIDWATGGPTASGERINEHGSMGLAAVWACVRCIAETLGSLTLQMYERTGPKSNAPVTQHPLVGLMKYEINDYTTPNHLRETLEGHVQTWGNGYSEIMRKGNEIVALEPRYPDRTRALLVNNRLWYAYNEQPGKIDPRAIPPANMIHVPGFGGDGISGLPPIQTHRETLGYSKAARDFGSRWFANGTKPSGILSIQGRVKDDMAEELRREWSRVYGGKNMHRPAVLGNGADWKQIGLPPGDSQFVEVQELLVGEICRIFRVPPHKIGYLKDAGDRANVEHSTLMFLQDCLFPRLVKHENEYNRKLLSRAERPRFFFKFKLETLLRGDIKTRYEAYAIARQWGWFSADDIRELEDMNPLPDGQGDIYLVPMNMTPAGELGQSIEAPINSQPSLAEAASLPARRALRSPLPGRRRRLERSFARLIRATGDGLISRETIRIKGAIKTILKSETKSIVSSRSLKTETTQWLERFYQKHAQAMTAGTLDLFLAFGEQMAEAASAEIGAEAGDLGEFVREYVRSMARRHQESHLGQLLALIAATETAELAAVLESRLDEWRERWPEKFASRESIQGGNAFAKAAWAAAGITTLRWSTTGENCPICAELEGRVVGIERSFVSSGETVGQGEQALVARQEFGHPPLHQGCQCTIVPAG